MGGKGGGGVDTSGLEQATREATALQEEIYNLTREDVQPWYNMGTGAVSRLSDLLGIGGGSMQSRDQIYNELLPQYTTAVTTPQPASGGMFIGEDGRVTTAQEAADYYGDTTNQYARGQGIRDAMDDPAALSELMATYGYTPAGGLGGTSESTDYAGLNAAVDAALAGQEMPDDYGSLLQRFGMEQYEADPGYQFRQDEANRALERQMAAQGITLGGAGAGDINPQAYRGMQELNQNLASQEYGNAYNRYVNDQLNTFNMLTGAAGMGQNSTGIMSGAGQNYATNVGNLQTGLASAQLNASMQNQGGGSMFGNLLGMGAGALMGNPGFGSAVGGALFGG